MDYIRIYRKSFIIRNWLTWLWLSSLHICRMSQVSQRLRKARDRGPVLSTKAREPGQSLEEFQTEKQAQDLERGNVSVWVWRQEKTEVPLWRQSGRNSLLVGKGSTFSFYSKNKLGVAHPHYREGKLPYSNNLNVSFIQQHPHRNTRIMSVQISAAQSQWHVKPFKYFPNVYTLFIFT